MAKAKKDKNAPLIKNNYVAINPADQDENGTLTEAMAIRGYGVVIRDTTSKGQVTSVFVPGCKIKTKKDYKFIQWDKPKTDEQIEAAKEKRKAAKAKRAAKDKAPAKKKK